MPQLKLKSDPTKNWINIRKVDKDWSLRDSFFQENIRSGADSVGKLMAVTYLSQFEFHTGEFARRPVYCPDFHIGYIPYSSSLLKDLENVASRGMVVISGIEGKLSTASPQLNHDATLKYFLNAGAQLARLYKVNESNLHHYNDEQLYSEVKRLWFQDRDSRRAYVRMAVPPSK